MTNFVKVIKSFSKERDDVKNKLQEYGEEFTHHCAKIIETTDKRTINSMIDELYKFCLKPLTYTLKPKKKRLSKEFVMEYFFSTADDVTSFSALLRFYRDLYKKEDTNKDQLKFDNYMQLADKVSEKISDKSLTKADLVNLVNQYLINI